jgi:hypothetical protein
VIVCFVDIGEIVEVPNLIRSLAPSSLIEQCNQLCEAGDIKPLGNKNVLLVLYKSITALFSINS